MNLYGRAQKSQSKSNIIIAILTSSLLHPASSLCFKKYTATREWQTFTSPQYPIAFPQSTRCIYRVEAPQGYKVRIEFVDFSLLEKSQSSTPPNAHCENQSLTLLNIDGRNSDPVVTLCGKVKPSRPLISKTMGFNIELNSNDVPYNYNYKGFQIKYKIESETMMKPLLGRGSGAASGKKPSSSSHRSTSLKGGSSSAKGKVKKNPKVIARDWSKVMALQAKIAAKTSTVATNTAKPKYRPEDHYCKPGYPCPKNGFFGQISELNQKNVQKKERKKVTSSLGIVALVFSVVVVSAMIGHKKWQAYKEEQEKLDGKKNKVTAGSQPEKVGLPSPSPSRKTNLTDVASSNQNAMTAHPANPLGVNILASAVTVPTQNANQDLYGLPQKKLAKRNPSYGSNLLPDYEIVKHGYSSQQTRNLANSKSYQVVASNFAALPGLAGNLQHQSSVHSNYNHNGFPVQNNNFHSNYQSVGNLSQHGLIVDQNSHRPQIGKNTPNNIARHMRKNLSRM